MKINVYNPIKEYSSLHFSRFNLDPEDKVSDWELWRSLEIAQLKSVVTELPNQLGKFNDDKDTITIQSNLSIAATQGTGQNWPL